MPANLSYFFNQVGWIEAEENKNRWKEYTEELCKKDLNNPNNHNGVVTYPETDILECEVKRAFQSTAVNKASGGNGVLAELFKILKDDAITVLHSICLQIWRTQQWPQDRKRSILILIPNKGSTKESLNHWIVALISQASKVMLKILHARLPMRTSRYPSWV